MLARTWPSIGFRLARPAFSTTIRVTRASFSSQASTDTTTKKPYLPVYTRTGDQGTSLLFNGQRLSKSEPYFHCLGEIDELNSTVGVALSQLDAERLRHWNHYRELQKSSSSSSQREQLIQSANAIAYYAQLSQTLIDIQSRLLDLGAHIATPRSSELSTEPRLKLTEFDEDGERVVNLEQAIDCLELDTRGFLLNQISPFAFVLDPHSLSSVPDSTPIGSGLPPLRNFILPGGLRAGPLSAQLHVCRSVCRRAERALVDLLTRKDASVSAFKYVNRLSDFFFVAARFSSRLSLQPDLTPNQPVLDQIMAHFHGDIETQWRKVRPRRNAKKPDDPSPTSS